MVDNVVLKGGCRLRYCCNSDFDRSFWMMIIEVDVIKVIDDVLISFEDV